MQKWRLQVLRVIKAVSLEGYGTPRNAVQVMW